ncbi:MAG: type II secretion system F family protein [Coraliomargaritaceae bacterium]
MSSNSKTLADWYLQLARHLEAGIPLPKAWSLPAEPAPKNRRQATEKLKAGLPLDQVIRESGNWLPKIDRENLLFADQSGRLPEMCQRLAGRHKRLFETNRRIRSKLVYPLIVFHLAALVLPLVRIIDFETGLAGFDLSTLLLQASSLLLPLWVVIGLLQSMAKTGNPLLPAILRCFPLLRGYAKNQSIADFCDVLGNAYQAGIAPQQAWAQAAQASKSPSLMKTNRAIQLILEKGLDPADVIAEHPSLPKDFIAYYKTGSTTGKLDSMLLELSQNYEERAASKLATATAFYPGIALLCVAALVAYSLFEFFGGYLDLLDSFTQ